MLRIAKVLMSLEVGRTEFYRQAAIDGVSPWEAHRRRVAERFNRDPGAYKSRLSEISRRALLEKTRVLMLPACALVLNPGETEAGYARCFSGMELVVAGSLGLGGDGRPIKNTEAAVALRPKGILNRLDYLTHNNDEKVRVFRQVALWGYSISTTIKYAPTARLPSRGRGKADSLLLLDLGHHQYNPTYFRMDIPAIVNRTIRAHGRPAVCLVNYWRWENCSDKFHSTYPEATLAVKSEYVEFGASGQRDGVEFVRFTT